MRPPPLRLTKLDVAAVTGDGYESDMPAFGEKLSDGEVKAVLDYIKSTWPKRARDSQAAITAADVAQNLTGAGQ